MIKNFNNFKLNEEKDDLHNDFDDDHINYDDLLHKIQDFKYKKDDFPLILNKTGKMAFPELNCIEFNIPKNQANFNIEEYFISVIEQNFGKVDLSTIRLIHEKEEDQDFDSDNNIKTANTYINSNKFWFIYKSLYINNIITKHTYFVINNLENLFTYDKNVLIKFTKLFYPPNHSEKFKYKNYEYKTSNIKLITNIFVMQEKLYYLIHKFSNYTHMFKSIHSHFHIK
jgi:hypothetical protein